MGTEIKVLSQKELERFNALWKQTRVKKNAFGGTWSIMLRGCNRCGNQVGRFALHLNVTAWMRLGISGLQEIRAIYKDNVIDVIALDQDLEREWKRLYNENIFIREESEKIIDR